MNATSRRRVGKVGLALLVVAGLLVLGAAGGLAYRWEDPPPILAQAVVAGQAPVTQRQFDDARVASFDLTMAPQEVVRSPRSGRVTVSNCTPGQVLVSGTVLIEVDGTPLIVLATDIPLWRDIERGARGKDIAALTAEMIRLGWFDGEATDTMTREVIEAFNQLALDLGVDKTKLNTWTVSQSLMVWLPPGDLAVESCQAAVGSSVSPDQVLIKFTSTLLQARLTTDMTMAQPGDRLLTLADRRIEVPTTGLITDPEQLQLIASSAEFRNARTDDDAPITLTGYLKLAQVLDLAVVPPAALAATGSRTGCVIVDGNPRPVQVVASELGQTFVRFDGPVPKSVQLNPPRDTTC